LMTENRIRHLPVVNNGKLIGMISIGDVVKFRIESVEREAEEMKNYIASAG
jgi:CBS domain-containing protein